MLRDGSCVGECEVDCFDAGPYPAVHVAFILYRLHVTPALVFPRLLRPSGLRRTQHPSSILEAGQELKQARRPVLSIALSDLLSPCLIASGYDRHPQKTASPRITDLHSHSYQLCSLGMIDVPVSATHTSYHDIASELCSRTGVDRTRLPGELTRCH